MLGGGGGGSCFCGWGGNYENPHTKFSNPACPHTWLFTLHMLQIQRNYEGIKMTVSQTQYILVEELEERQQQYVPDLSGPLVWTTLPSLLTRKLAALLVCKHVTITRLPLALNFIADFSFPMSW